MRRKNRQIKMTINIPEDYETEEEFMLDMQERMYADGVNWTFQLETEAGFERPVHISAVTLGDIEIAKEEED